MGGLDTAPHTRLLRWGPRHGPHTPRRSERPREAVALLDTPRRSERPGKAVAPLDTPNRLLPRVQSERDVLPRLPDREAIRRKILRGMWEPARGPVRGL